VIAKISHGIGELFITVGLVLLLFVAYELWGTGLQTARDQSAAAKELSQQWADLPTVGGPDAGPGSGSTSGPAEPGLDKVAIGDGFAVIRIPRFGTGYHWVIHEGVSRKVLKTGPGHYPKTAMPGEVGNFAVAGHRTTFGAPFNRAAELHPGDAIVIETGTTWYTYRVRSHEIVAPSALEVTAKVPHKPGATATERLLTFTTCHPKLSAKERYIVYGVLEARHSKRGGALPPALAAA
jgi:sortase A